jgi:hypothetical protein
MRPFYGLAGWNYGMGLASGVPIAVFMCYCWPVQLALQFFLDAVQISVSSC